MPKEWRSEIDNISTGCWGLAWWTWDKSEKSSVARLRWLYFMIDFYRYGLKMTVLWQALKRHFTFSNIFISSRDITHNVGLTDQNWPFSFFRYFSSTKSKNTCHMSQFLHFLTFFSAQNKNLVKKFKNKILWGPIIFMGRYGPPAVRGCRKSQNFYRWVPTSVFSRSVWDNLSN